jgi:hypothetical protein
LLPTGFFFGEVIRRIAVTSCEKFIEVAVGSRGWDSVRLYGRESIVAQRLAEFKRILAVHPA